ncbi:hypothetical protein Pla123a_09580 [Posidoniimonas polymericola]|uniref:PEP-CTERM protein-sorting domain-containing protein n=1 Tax=Posidoniimonas polymericola TaxID=2528002 RepID=A0A5C5YT90_9BACT|nr:hypothetical protein [Posidoniimonas polymericola]TWT78168.1 hypothetical protein Pla123a_09580 [Posidoniimonas polymericola]
MRSNWIPRLAMKAITLAAAAAVGLSAGGALANHLTYYTVDFSQLNDSNVAGNAVLTHDTDLNTLRVEISALNLEPDMDHMMHIHGTFDSGSPSDATVPTLAQDTDGDGFIEVLEGVASYGDIILPLGTETAPLGVIDYDQTFDLSDDSLFFSPVTSTDYTAADLMPLSFREIVIHGKTVASGIGAGTDGEVDGTGGYLGLLPVAAGEIVGPPVPEPATALLAMGAVAAIATGRRRVA